MLRASSMLHVNTFSGYIRQQSSLVLFMPFWCFKLQEFVYRTKWASSTAQLNGPQKLIAVSEC